MCGPPFSIDFRAKKGVYYCEAAYLYRFCSGNHYAI